MVKRDERHIEMWRASYRRWLSRREPIYTEALCDFYERMERATACITYTEFMNQLSSREASRYLLAFDRWLVEANPQATGQDYYWRSTLLGSFFPNSRQEQADLKCAAALDPGNVDIWVSLGHLALMRNRPEEALKDYEHGVKAAPTNFFPRYGKALAYLQLGRYEEALRDIDVAIENHPHFAWGYETRGRIYERMGELEGAQADLDYVMHCGQPLTEIRWLRCRIWVRLQWKKVIEMRNRSDENHM